MNPVWGWEPQTTPPVDTNLGTCPRSCLVVCLDTPCGFFGLALSSLQHLWVIKFSISVALVVCCWTATHHLAPWALIYKCFLNKVITVNEGCLFTLHRWWYSHFKFFKFLVSKVILSFIYMQFNLCLLLNIVLLESVNSIFGLVNWFYTKMNHKWLQLDLRTEN